MWLILIALWFSVNIIRSALEVVTRIYLAACVTPVRRAASRILIPSTLFSSTFPTLAISRICCMTVAEWVHHLHSLISCERYQRCLSLDARKVQYFSGQGQMDIKAHALRSSLEWVREGSDGKSTRRIQVACEAKERVPFCW